MTHTVPWRVTPKELVELSGLAVNFDRWGTETFTGTLVSAMIHGRFAVWL